MQVWSFGVEIEFFIPNQRVTALKNFVTGELRGSNQSYTHLHSGAYNGWSLHRDGSLISSSGKNEGLELVSPPFCFKNAEEGFESIRLVMERLRSLGAFVNRKCGFHIHLGGKRIRELDYAQLLQLERFWVETAQDKFITLLPAHRKSNRYCRKNTYNIGGGDRYKMLNVIPAHQRHSTVEFRLFQGTLNPDRAKDEIERVKKFMNSFKA